MGVRDERHKFGDQGELLLHVCVQHHLHDTQTHALKVTEAASHHSGTWCECA